jgi:glycosyltransferase involved in cell wall biosynthesis
MNVIRPTPARRTVVSVSFVIPVRNAAAELPRCLASITATVSPHDAFEIIVVDNGSSDASADIARRFGACVLDRPGLRVGACRNAGAAVAAGDILAFVDADNEVVPGWLDACARAFEGVHAGAAGYPYHAPRDATWVQRMYDALRDKPTGRCDLEWLGAGNLAVRRMVFEEVGGFDERLEACEDVHLCRKLRRAGYRIASVPEMESVHHGDPRTLSELFFGELWRGRDNLRVSFSGPLSLRTLASTLLPMAFLTCLVLLALGVLSWPWVNGTAAAAAAFGLVALVISKAFVIITRGRLTTPLVWAQAFVVAATYEVARALSLVSSATHRTRVRVPRHA